MALENGLLDPLLAPPAVGPLFLRSHYLPNVICRCQASSGKGRPPGTEFPDGRRLKRVWAYRGATQSLTAQGSQKNRLDNFVSIPVRVTTDRLGVDFRGNQGLAPGTEGEACYAIQTAVVRWTGLSRPRITIS